MNDCKKELSAIAVFKSTHETLRAERSFKEQRIKVRATVKPRAITSNCQMAVQFSPDDIDRIKSIIAEEKLDFIGYFRKIDNNWVPYSQR